MSRSCERQAVQLAEQLTAHPGFQLAAWGNEERLAHAEFFGQYRRNEEGRGQPFTLVVFSQFSCVFLKF
jgi:hypothetical protein